MGNGRGLGSRSAPSTRDEDPGDGDAIVPAAAAAAKLKQTLGPVLQHIAETRKSEPNKLIESVPLSSAGSQRGFIENPLAVTAEKLATELNAEDSAKIAAYLHRFEDTLVDHCHTIFLDQERQTSLQLELKNEQIRELHRVVQAAVEREKQ